MWAGALLVASATTAWAEPPLVSLGENADLRFTALGTVRSDDNVFLSSSDAQSDIIAILAPGLLLEYGDPETDHGHFSAAETFLQYMDFTEENDNLGSFDGAATFLGARSKLDLTGAYQQLRQNSRDVRSATTLIRQDQTSFRANGEYEISVKTSIGAYVSYGDNNYQTAGFVNHSQYAGGLNGYYEVTPKVDMSLGYRYQRSRVEDFSRSRYSDNFWNVGLRGDFTPKLTGNVQVGVAQRSRNIGSSENILAIDANVHWQSSPKLTYGLTLSRDFRSSGATGESVTDTQATLDVDYEIAPEWRVTGSAGYQSASYYGGRNDDYVTLEVTTYFAWSQDLIFGLGIAIDDNQSNLPFAEFHRNALSLSASFRY